MPDAILVTSSFLPGRGGIESYLAELCDALAPRLAVLAPGRREGRALPGHLAYPASPGPGRMLWPSARVAGAIEAFAARHSTERVIFGTPWPLVLTGPRLLRAGLRYAVIVHGAELAVPAALPGLKAKLARALAGAELLLPVSRYTADRIERLLDAHGLALPRVEVARARVDLERFYPDVDPRPALEHLGVVPQGPVVLCFGRLVPRKGVRRVIDAMPEIERRVPGAALVVAGTGPEERKLRRAAAAQGVSAHFAGRVPDEIAPSYYSLADVFVLAVADRYFGLEIEGLGVVLLEAAACGTPCVTGRSGGTPEAVVDGVTGFVVDARDRSELVERIVGLLEDREGAEWMGLTGRAHVADEFSSHRALAPVREWLG